jgi:hypothetical protein
MNKKMISFRGQARWAKMTPPGGKLTSLACHLTKKLYKAEELIYPSTSNDLHLNVVHF